MLHANLVTTYQRLAASADASARGRVSTSAIVFPHLSPGQAVSALILERLRADRFLADIDGQPIELDLPAPVAPGELVRLRLLRSGPEPRFELLGNPPSAAEPQRPAALSDGARLIQSILATGAASPAPVGEAPPLSSTPIDARVTAEALRRSIADSGTFYESHLAAWAAGERATSSLRREPQGSWGLDPPFASPPPASADDPEIRAAFSDQAGSVLRRQLDAAENHRVTWSGAIWPGQYGTIEICEEFPHRRSPAAPDSVWRSALSLVLPRLGELRAEVSLSAQRLAIELKCGAGGAKALLVDALPQLRERCRAAALPMPDCIVSADGAR